LLALTILLFNAWHDFPANKEKKSKKNQDKCNYFWHELMNANPIPTCNTLWSTDPIILQAATPGDRGRLHS
jgi:hypothetical protein